MSIRAADEKTELLLMEYLDGTLADDKRAELEAYLKAHPKEKQVLEDLAEHSRRLRATPTESAPAEIFEVAQSQLERAALLDHFTDDAPIAPGRRAGPQWMSLAAVFVLGTGLATALYFVLAPDGRPVDYATLPPPMPGIGAGTGKPENAPAAATAERRDNARTNTPDNKPVVLADGKDRSAGGSAPDPQAVARGTLGESGTFGKQRTALAAPAAKIAADTPSPASTVEPVIRRVSIPTSDVALSRSRVEAVLQSGGWAYAAMSADTALKDETESRTSVANQSLTLAPNTPPQNNYGQAPEQLTPSVNQQSPQAMLDQHQMMPSDRSPTPPAGDSNSKELATRPAENTTPPASNPASPTNPPSDHLAGPTTRPDASAAPAESASTRPEGVRPPEVLPIGERERRTDGTAAASPTGLATEVLVVRVESDQADALIAALASIGKSALPLPNPSAPSLLPGSPQPLTSNDPTAAATPVRQATTRDTMTSAKMVRLVVTFEAEAPAEKTESPSTQPATTGPSSPSTLPTPPLTPPDPTPQFRP